jgi:hypothetical protein
MIVHLTGSSRDSGADLPYLRKLVDIVHKRGDEVAHNWVETSNITIKKSEQGGEWDWRSIVEANVDAIKRADAIIVEVSSYGFFQGYQVAVALDQSKPVLLVSRNSINDLAVSGINDPLLRVEEYSDEQSLEEIAKKFLQDFAPQKLEIKVKIDSNSKLQSYLQEQTARLDKTEAQILRDLVDTGLKVKAKNC